MSHNTKCELYIVVKLPSIFKEFGYWYVVSFLIGHFSDNFKF